LQVLHPAEVTGQTHGGAQPDAGQKENRLVCTGAGRFQDSRHGDAAGKSQSLEIDHLLAEGNDKRHAQKAACHAAEYHQDGIEIGLLEDEQGRNGEHHAGGRRVDAAGDRLVDVVLNDALAVQDTSQDAKAQNGGQLGALVGEAQNQGGIAEADGDEDADAIAEQQGSPSELRV